MEGELLYKIDDKPPWVLSIFLAFQHHLASFGGTLVIPLIIAPYLCMEETDPARGHLVATLYFVSGFITLFQVTFGVRLPIIQGGTYTYLAPTIAMMSLPRWTCPDTDVWANMTQPEKTEEWQIRMRQIQGAIMVSSVLEILIGCLGIVGLMLKFITPLVLVPSVSLVGLSIVGVAAEQCTTNWPMALGTIVLLIILSQYLQSWELSLPYKYTKDKGWHTFRSPLVNILAIFLVIVIMWTICAILTATDAVDVLSPLRTDAKLDIIKNSPWFRVPYPFQWGIPTVSVGDVIGLFSAIIASILESVGDYYSCARLSGAPTPPAHAINRGIATEGFGCLIAGFFGTGNGTTSYSNNVAAIGITRVGSRRVIVCVSFLMIILGVIPKLNSAFVTIPEPILGGVLVVIGGIVTAVGFVPLQYVDLNSARNLFVLGFPLFWALVLSEWITANPTAIQTGSSTVDQILYVIISTPMCVGSLTACFLDNTLPGAAKSRKLLHWEDSAEDKEASDINLVGESVYDLPFITHYLKRWTWTRYVPFLPTFGGWPWENRANKSPDV